MGQSSITDRIAALALVLLTLLQILQDWRVADVSVLIPWVTVAVLVLFGLGVRLTRKAFVAVGILLTLALALTDPDWLQTVRRALGSAAFIAAFFTAIATLRNAAETSPAIRAAGSFLAAQPPGRRYLALTTGGHLFALLLNYGAISLLGSLASTSARAEPDPELRRHRTRRMLVAIQRGFLSSLPWSPLAFAMAVTVALVPGASWADAALPGMVTGLIIAGTGWALDTVFKPRLTTPPPARKPVEGSWRLLLPLLMLLVLMGVTVAGLHEATGIRFVGVVMLVVPVIAVAWSLIQTAGGPPGLRLGRRLGNFVAIDLPGYRGEIVLLMMAGYIGTVGAPLLVPLVASAGLDIAALPAWLVLVAFVWVIPAFGQLGMNPILAVTLISPLIPDAAQMGVTPTAIVTAIAAGWAISGASSPFTATTLLIGAFGGVSAVHVGLRWNGGFVLVCAVLLSLWVSLYAFVLS